MSRQEQDALERLEEQERSFRRGALVISENDSARELFIVRGGWLHSSLNLGDGSRQIMRFHFQGDIIGLPLLAFSESPESITAVTDVTLASFARERVAELFNRHPRLSALILALSVADRVSLADRIASIGRTSARARIASLICEFFSRARILHGPRTDAMQIPLTQEEIGDATGLTAVHVNRMMRGLVDDGIIERSGHNVRLLDEHRLISEANFADRTGIETDWLPDPR